MAKVTTLERNFVHKWKVGVTPNSLAKEIDKIGIERRFPRTGSSNDYGSFDRDHFFNIS